VRQHPRRMGGISGHLRARPSQCAAPAAPRTASRRRRSAAV
jgi:hypothetical protein